MFKSLSVNPPDPPGKHTDWRSLDAKASHFDMGDAKMGDEKTATQMAFTGYMDQKLEKVKPMPKPVSQIVMGETVTGYTTTK